MPGEDPWTGIPPTWCAPCRGRPAKNQANISKHGVAFETAKRIFEGPMVTWFDDRREYGEERFISDDQVARAHLVVAHTKRDGRIRLISARPASRRERQAYHERTR